MSQENKESWAADLIESCDDRGDIVSLDDGFKYYWVSNRGALSAESLRVIADELDRRNADWKQSIEEHFSKEADHRDE